MLSNLTDANYKTVIVFYDAVKKRGIYPVVTVNQTNSMINSLEPSQKYDVLYFTENAPGAGQYFYASAKHGKQVFSWDRSPASSVGQVASFLDAIQSLAIRE
jgi:hypothetical protein